MTSKRTCSIDGCSLPAKARGWCNTHYLRWKQKGDPLYVRPVSTCSVERCPNGMLAKGYCNRHYKMWKKYGDPLALQRLPHQLCGVEGCVAEVHGRGWCHKHFRRWTRHGDPLGGGTAHLPWPENLLQRTQPQPNGCVHFTGTLVQGYGRVSREGNQTFAHRAAYELFVGPIPEGYSIDHECHNHADPPCNLGDACLHRRCVNPVHLVAKPIGENVSASPNSNAAKTHCPQGHPYDGENTYTAPGTTWRQCRRCSQERAATRNHLSR